MEDIEKVMSWLEGLSQDDWRDFHSDSEVQNIAKVALELLKEQESTINELQNAYCYLQKQYFEAQDKLLKEQEAVEPKTEPSSKGYWYTCGSCGWWLFQVCDTVHFDDRKRIHFCASCGRSVKWNA